MEQDRIFNYDVYDNEGKKIGGVDACWISDRTEDLEFIGVKTGWLSGSNHVVPASAARIDETQQRIDLPYSEDDVKDAPAFKPKHDLTAADEADVRAYYGPLSGAELHGEERSPGAVGHERDADARESVEMPLREEEVDVGKREVRGEGVRLRKVVRTEHKEVPVELEREEVHVERVPPGEIHGEASDAFEEDETVIETRREEPVVHKETHLTGGVRAYKTRDTERRTLDEDVRREDAEIERDLTGRREGREDADTESSWDATGIGRRPPRREDRY